jgi:hypothetical protein
MQTLLKKFISPENASETDYGGHMGVKTLLMQNSGVFVIARLFIKHSGSFLFFAAHKGAATKLLPTICPPVR